MAASVVFEGFDESGSADEGGQGFVEIEGSRRVVVMVGRGRRRGVFVKVREGRGGGIGGGMSDVKTCEGKKRRGSEFEIQKRDRR